MQSGGPDPPPSDRAVETDEGDEDRNELSSYGRRRQGSAIGTEAAGKLHPVEQGRDGVLHLTALASRLRKLEPNVSNSTRQRARMRGDAGLHGARADGLSSTVIDFPR